ncbi:MAG TPA: LeuA family protein [Thermoanaerobaculia bacterium]
MTENLEHLIHDWNVEGEQAKRPSRKIEFDDETLRDGLQSPSVTDPSIEDKLQILHYMHAIGIDNADIGLPGAGPHVQQTVERLAREIVEQKLSVYPSAAGRTHENDVRPIIDISQRVGIAIEADLFIGSSPIRQFAEEWDLDWIIQQSAKAVRFAVDNGIPVMYVTEDTTRAKPDDIAKLYTAAIEAGATRVCIADTVGHATPWGTRNLVRFVRELVDRVNPEVKIDWHGHEDRALGIINCIAAIEGGADQVHGSALGLGERVGNTPMDQLLVNLKLMGWIDNDLSRLREYCDKAAESCGWTIPVNYPVFGRDAFRTATGVHAAAVVKCFRKGDEELADLVYSGVPAGLFGMRQQIEVGPMSGKSNVVYWLESRGLEATDERVQRIYDHAKGASGVLGEEEVMQLV